MIATLSNVGALGVASQASEILDFTFKSMGMGNRRVSLRRQYPKWLIRDHCLLPIAYCQRYIYNQKSSRYSCPNTFMSMPNSNPNNTKRLAKCNPKRPSTSPIPIPPSQPNPPKQYHNRDKEPQPRLPPHARLLGHPQHPAHGALYLIPRVLKLVVHLLREGCRVADLVADEVR
jgi:hypothetical protein